MQHLRIVLALERNVLVLSGTVFLLLTSLFTWSQLLPLHFRDLGAGDAQVGLAYSLSAIAFALMQFIGGFLADQYGRKMLIVLSTFALVPFYILEGAAQGWPALFAAMFFISSLSAIQSPAFTSLLAESVPESRQGVALGTYQFALSLATTVGPGLGALLFRLVGLRRLIYTTAIMTLFCAILRAVLLREARYLPPPVQLRRLEHFHWEKFCWALTVTCLFTIISALTLCGPFISLHAEDVLGFDKPQINSLFAMSGFASMLTSLLSGRLVEHYGSRDILIGASLGQVVATTAWAMVGTSPLGRFLFVAAAVGFQMAVIAYSVLLIQLTAGRSRGTLIGLFGAVTGIVSAITHTAGAYLRASFGSIAPFWAALGSGLAMIFFPRLVSTAVKLIIPSSTSPRSFDELLEFCDDLT